MGNKGMKTSQPEGEITFPFTDLKSNTVRIKHGLPPDDRIRHRARAACCAPGGGTLPSFAKNGFLHTEVFVFLNDTFFKDF